MTPLEQPPLSDTSADPAAVVFVAAPPFTGIFHESARRLEGRCLVVEPELFSGEPSGSSGELESLAERLRVYCESLGTTPVLVGHGLSLPLLWHFAGRFPVRGLVLSDGLLGASPLSRALLHIFAGGISRRLLTRELLLREPLLRAWLSSSLGLRRLVQNPYVMDRPTVRRGLEPLTSATGRACMVRYLAEIADFPWGPLPGTIPVLYLWGSADPLFPLTSVKDFRRVGNHGIHVTVPLGRAAWPEERPWILADSMIAWLRGDLRDQEVVT